jgi:hypothetical protein
MAGLRHTTLAALIEQALQCELQTVEAKSMVASGDSWIVVGPYGFPRMKRRETVKITSEAVRQMADSEDI